MAKMDKLLARAAPIASRLPAGRPHMVELGVYAADLSRHLLELRRDMTITCVDPWRADGHPAAYMASGDPHAELTQETQNRYYRTAIDRLSHFGNRAEVLRTTSVDAALCFRDGSVDLVFIDGDHSFEGCLADCLAWWPKVKPGGWLGGHDYANPDPRFRFGVDEAVGQFSAEIGMDFELDGGMTWWMRKPA